MTKEEFINKLKKKISMLEQSEIDDIISEYEGFIDEKMASGMSEEEAVKSLGNVDEIAKDLKSAYKIDSDYNESSAKNVIDTAIDKMMKGIDIVIKSFENKSASDVITMIIKIFLLVIAIRVCKFPVDVLLSIAHETFMFLGSALGGFLYHIFSFAINVIYVILAVLIFYKIVKDKIIGEDVINEINKKEKVKKENVKETKKEDKVVNETKKPEVVKEVPKRKGFFDVCSEIVLAFIKFIVFWIAFGDLFFIVGVSSALVIAIYLIVHGVTYFGPALILFALALAGISFLEVFIRFVFDSKQRVVRFLITLILSLVIGGAGIGIFSLEIANTSIVNEIPKDKMETVTEEYDMDNNMVISNNLVTEYVKDDSLKDKVKIEYTYYYDYFEFEPNTYVNEIDGYKVYHMNYNVNWGTNSFKNLIRDLKKKKFNNVMDVVTVKVITSNSNIKTIKRNNENYVSRNDIEFDGVDLDELDEDDIGSIGMR